MHELFEDLEEMCETLADELSKTNDKLEKSGGQISAGDVLGKDLGYRHVFSHSRISRSTC